MKPELSDIPTTTRRYPRTLDEAFPMGARYGSPIEGPYRRPLRVAPLAWVVAAVCVLLVAAL
jgi:hypothetical protein